MHDVGKLMTDGAKSSVIKSQTIVCQLEGTKIVVAYRTYPSFRYKLSEP